MATLDTSQNGPSITQSYKRLVALPPPDKPSPTYASWALYSVSAPLQNAFIAGPGKDSVLKVQSTGEGELEDLIDEFSEGKVQFAFVRVKDPNSGLAKFALIGWCGDGVPERVKGYFNGHLATVSKILTGYHVQITARDTSDLTPDAILRKIENASGAKYSEATKPKPPAPAAKPSSGPAPAVATKPLYLNKPIIPSKVTGATFKPRTYGAQTSGSADNDGWGDDAPPVSRSELEKVPPAYKPTKVDIAALKRGKDDSTSGGGRPEPVRGAYQPIGKVDIAEIRRQANYKEERAEPVKGTYQPIGKVDIAAIRAQAKPRQEEETPAEPAPTPVSQRAAAFSKPAEAERLTSLPKPKPAKKFGSGAPSFGTKPPTPGILNTPPAPQVGTASVDYASQGGKTPAQIWAEKKARERGLSGASETTPPSFSGNVSAAHTGVSQNYTGRSVGSSGGVADLASRFSQQKIEDQPASEPTASVSELKNKFGGVPVTSYSTGRSASPPPPSPPISSRPTPAATVSSFARATPPVVPTPARPESPSAFSTEGSPIQIAMPVARGKDEDVPPIEQAEEQYSPPARASAPSPEPVHHRQPSPEPVAQPSYGTGGASGGLTAVAQYDYQKEEDNEINLVDGETITDIDQVDADWWEGTNSRGERGLFPSNYVELVEGGGTAAAAPAAAPVHEAEPEPETAAVQHGAADSGYTATAEYDYEAAEDNELSFPEGAKITNVEFPDDDWWSGTYNGKVGLFPANYVKLDQQ